MNWWGWIPWWCGGLRSVVSDTRTTRDLCVRLGQHTYTVPVCFDAQGRAVYSCSTCGHRQTFWRGRAV